MDRDRRRFGEKMVAELRRQGATGPLALDEEQFRIEIAPERYLMLENAFADWRAAPRLRRSAVLRQYAALFAGEPPQQAETLDEARPNLLLRVADRAWYATLELRGAASLTYAPLAEHLAVELVYDHPTSISSVPPAALERWGLDLDEALHIARTNLRLQTDGTFEPVGPGVYASPWHDNYDAARLMLPELVNRLDVRGDAVALLPHRDHLLVAGSDDPTALDRIAELALPLLEQNRSITGRAIVWREDRWEPFVPSRADPYYQRFRHLLRVSQAREYADQTAALDERNEADGVDVFVASVMLAGVGDVEEVTSFSSWADGVTTLLPRTDAIAFARGSENEPTATFVPWDAAIEVVGHLMQPQDLVPERWLVDDFPDDAQLAALAARAS